MNSLNDFLCGLLTILKSLSIEWKDKNVYSPKICSKVIPIERIKIMLLWRKRAKQ